jgi:hypothetical protein
MSSSLTANKNRSTTDLSDLQKHKKQKPNETEEQSLSKNHQFTFSNETPNELLESDEDDDDNECEEEEEEEEEEENNCKSENKLKKKKKTKGRVKIKMEFIENKIRRYTTFSKRKTGIMKKAYELSTLTGTQVMLLVASETGHVYTFATKKLQPMITSEVGRNLIQQCLGNSNDLKEDTGENEYLDDHKNGKSNNNFKILNQNGQTNRTIPLKQNNIDNNDSNNLLLGLPSNQIDVNNELNRQSR